VSLLTAVAGLGSTATAFGSETGPPAGPFAGSAFILPRQGAGHGVELQDAALRYTFPAATGGCAAQAGGAAFASLGGEVAIGAPALNDCGGAVLIVPSG